MTTYSVVVLGLSGSGKTVYLASMYKRLQVNGPIGFFLDIEDYTGKNRLVKTYSQVAAVDEPWPPGTVYGEVSEWNFKCRVQLPNLKKFTACEFTYLDYAGGRIDNTTQASDPSFINKLKNADAILGLLDGEKVLDLMRGGENYLDLELKYLPYIIPDMQRPGVNNPVHFVISKWDLLEDQFSLGQVREKLLQIDIFKQLVQNRIKAGSQVRLIPVSALGKGFAVPEIGPDKKLIMKKVKEAVPDPFQVEMPIACILPDIIRLKLNEIKTQKAEEIASSPEVDPNLSFWDTLRLASANLIKSVRAWLPPDYNFSHEAIQKIIDLVEKEPKEKQQAAAQRNAELLRMRDKRLRAVQDEETALEYAITCFLQVENTLSYRYPESTLNLPFYEN